VLSLELVSNCTGEENYK